LVDDLPKEPNVNRQYFRDVVFEEDKRAVIAINKKSGIEEVMIHMDNCRVHNSAERLEEFQVTQLPHPLYSPNISP
jgi:hypothetical protein